MQRIVEELRSDLSAFVEQRDALTLVLWAKGPSDFVYAHQLLDSMDQASSRDVYILFADDFYDIERYVDSFMAACDQDIDIGNEAIAKGLGDDDVEPWPGLPAPCFDGSLRPVARIQALIAHLRTRMPDPTNRIVLAFLPSGRLSDPEGYQEEGVTYEERLELEDGRVVSVHLAPVFFRRDFLGTVSVFRDITHQVEVDRLKSEFVATVSHELRTPMTAIKGYVDILLLGAAGPLNDQQRHFLETVKNNTERLNLLVSDLLDISRIEAGRVALSPETFSLADLIREVLAEQERIAKEEGREMAFRLTAPDDLPLVYADHERVRQIVENLVENAYRYTQPGGRVTVRVHREDDAIQVDVSDTGIGIPPEEQGRVFERFYRGENPLVMASAGTGLGLAIVKTLVEMHGGRIWLESSGVPGEGSTFSFTLPLTPPLENEQAKPDSREA